MWNKASQALIGTYRGIMVGFDMKVVKEVTKEQSAFLLDHKDEGHLDIFDVHADKCLLSTANCNISYCQCALKSHQPAQPSQLSASYKTQQANRPPPSIHQSTEDYPISHHVHQSRREILMRPL